MAELRFVTEVGRETSTQMTSSGNELNTQLTNLTNRVNTMVGSDWIAPAANQFQSEFQTWSSQMSQTIQQLEALRQRLDAEIAEWETTAGSV